MTDMIFCCPACNNFLVVDEKGVDKTIKCPFCEVQIQVPRPHLRTRCPLCGNLLRAPGFMRTKTIDCPKCNQPFAISQNSACISCGKNLQQDAVFCGNCGVDQRSGAKLSAEVSPNNKISINRRTSSINSNLSKASPPVEAKSAFTARGISVLIVSVLLIGLAGVVIHYGKNDAGKVQRQRTKDKSNQLNMQRPIATVDSKAPIPEDNKVVKHIMRTLKTLKYNPADPVALEDLIWCLENVNEDGNGRNVLAGMKTIYALQQLSTGDDSNGLEECELINKLYSDTKFVEYINPVWLYIKCQKCQDGEVMVPCIRCGGKGVCPSCRLKATKAF
jgi:hypothetical protein